MPSDDKQKWHWWNWFGGLLGPTFDWWSYVFSPRSVSARSWGVSRIATARCRIQGHPLGPIFYNPGGLEPDMRCRYCGDEL